MRYAITDLGGPLKQTPADRRLRLLRDLRRWADGGIDFVQLREKGLAAGEVFVLADAAMRCLRQFAAEKGRNGPQLLVNGRADIAASAGAHGIHLTATPGELSPEQARAVFRAAGRMSCTVGVSCHTLEDVWAAGREGADTILFGPVFEKRIRGERVLEGTGLEMLRFACQIAGATPVFALGGVTGAGIELCLRAGAAGVAGIRLFG